VPLDEADRERLADRFGLDPAQHAQWGELAAAGIAAHLRVCGPCGQDFEGLLAAVRGLI
jgi:hypothetical protein